MVNITHKSFSKRQAIAQAIVKLSQASAMLALQQNTVPKGNVFESARVAALFGVKKTSELIPDCHPLPVEYTKVEFEMGDMEIRILVEVHTVYKTGVEVEAMHGASIAALTMYDMLKPIDKGIEIGQIKLLEKKGGKSDFTDKPQHKISAAVIVCSDTISAGKKEDVAGKSILSKLEKHCVNIDRYLIIPDEVKTIQDVLIKLSAEKLDIIIFCGGTGLSPRDNTPEAVKPLLDREVPGIMETARNYGQQQMPYAMLSRGIAGMRGSSLVLTLPGSTRGAEESMDALFPYLLHIFRVRSGAQHE